MGNIKDKFNNMIKGIESIWDDIYSLGFSNGYEIGVLDGEARERKKLDRELYHKALNLRGSTLNTDDVDKVAKSIREE